MASASVRAASASIACPGSVQALRRSCRQYAEAAAMKTYSPLLLSEKLIRGKGIQQRAPQYFDKWLPGRPTPLRASTSPSPSVKEEEAEDPFDSVDVCELVLGNEVELGVEGGSPQEPIEAYFAKAVKNNNGSGVLLLTDILGIHNDDTRDYAFRLACFGYNVFMPDLFRGEPWEEGRDKAEFDTWRAQHKPERVASDIALAHKYLVNALAEHGAGTKGEGRIALVGFCFGGGRLVEQLAADTEEKYSAGVSFYGTKYDAKLGEKVKAPLLLIAGDSDPMCTVDFLKDVEKSLKKGRNRAPSKIKIYKDRKHAFAHHPKFEDDADADDAFELAKDWLRQHLLHIEPHSK